MALRPISEESPGLELLGQSSSFTLRVGMRIPEITGFSRVGSRLGGSRDAGEMGVRRERLKATANLIPS